MMLSDMGADVIRVERVGTTVPEGEPPEVHIMNRGRRSVAVDLKCPEGVELLLKLVERCDGLIEGFRPGTMERLGLGPSVCLERNPKLAYGRATGWGQTGPFAAEAGHDLNYIALAGALHPIGPSGAPPPPPLNMIADFGGGGMLLAFGVVCGILRARAGGAGQVIDAAMIDGTALLTVTLHTLRARGLWTEPRGHNLIDGGAHFYRSYRCKDDRYVSIAAVEPAFYANLLRVLELDPQTLPDQLDREHWPAMSERFAAMFLTKDQAEWCALMHGHDACFAPVLDAFEAPAHPHLTERATFQEVGGIVQPAPAPRFSRTPGAIQHPPPPVGTHTDDVLHLAGLDQQEIVSLRDRGVVA